MYYCCSSFSEWIRSGEKINFFLFHSVPSLSSVHVVLEWKVGIFILFIGRLRGADPANINRVCFHADNKQFSRSFEHVGEI